MKTNRIAIIILGISILVSSNLLPAEEEDRVELKGNFEFGYRYVDINGNRDKYYEDLNLRKGPRLLTLNFDILSSGKYKNFFDLLNIYASTIGGDPFESYGFNMKKYGSFNFRYSHRKSTYYYKDTILPPALADLSTSNGGDFHIFNFERYSDSIFFDVRFLKRAKLSVSFDRQRKSGESTTSIDIGRDEFEFDKPIDELKTEYKAGLQIDLDKADIYLEGSYHEYENHSRLFLPGFSAGADSQNVDNPTVLNFFELLTPYDYTMPMFTAKLNFRPINRIRATFAFTYSDMEMDMNYRETALGVDYTGLPLDYTDTGSAEINRKFNLVDFDISLKVVDWAYLIGGFRYNKLKQDGELDIEATTYDSLIDMNTTIYEAGAQVLPYKTLSLSGGVRFESRDALYETDTPEEEVTTERTTFFINGNYNFSNKLSLLGEYERGTYNNPYTLISVTDLNRFKVRAKIKPVYGLNLILSYLLRDMENEDSGGEYNSNTLAIDVAYNLKSKFDMSAGYSYQKIKTSITNVIPFQLTFPPFTLTEATWNILYESKNNILRGALKYKFNANLSAGATVHYSKNTGTWELDWTTIQGWVKYTLNSGYSIFLSYRWNDYHEELYSFDDYSSNIFTLGFGYRF